MTIKGIQLSLNEIDVFVVLFAGNKAHAIGVFCQGKAQLKWVVHCNIWNFSRSTKPLGYDMMVTRRRLQAQ